MIELWYINIDEATPELCNKLLGLLPDPIQQDIMRYKFFRDRKLKLFARLLVVRYHQEKFGYFNWSQWKNDPDGKPSSINGIYFNITHSGDYVSVAFSKNEIGIDLEKIGEADIEAFSECLHFKEKEYILQSNTKRESFYEVWTRKESFLKAKGVGLKNGLSNENCLSTIIEENQKWFIHSLSLIKGYQLAVCTPLKDVAIFPFEVVFW